MSWLKKLFARRNKPTQQPTPSTNKPFVSIFDACVAQYAEEDRRAAEEAASYSRSGLYGFPSPVHQQAVMDASHIHQMHMDAIQMDMNNQMQQMQMHQTHHNGMF